MSDETKEEIENEEVDSTASEATDSEASEAEASEASADSEVSEASEVAEDSEAEASEAEESSEAEASDGESSEVSEAEEDEEPAPAISSDPHERETEELERGDWETVEVGRGEESSVSIDEDQSVLGVAAFFDHPDHLMYAAEQTRDSDYESYDAYSPFPIHGMDDAMGLERSWIPWVTFFAGATGLTVASSLEFGIMGFDWPMVFGGKPFIAWPSFVPIMFELTVLLAGTTTALIMFIASGCFRKPLIIDKDITNDRFVLWISSDDDQFDQDGVIEFMKDLNPSEIRTVRGEG